MSNTLQELREVMHKKAKGSANLKKPVISTENTPKTSYKKPSKNNKSPGKDGKSSEECFIVIPDVHSYERDDLAYEITMEATKVLSDNYNCTKVVQLGDLMECGEISGHPPSHVRERIPSYVDEVDWALNDFWARIRENVPGAELHAHLGNHEHRVNNWLLNRLGRGKVTESVYDDINPTSFYKKEGINVIPYGEENPTDGTLELFPGLVTLHGWSTATNCAKIHLEKMLGATSVIHGHTHRIQSYTRRNPIKNELVGAWSIGALAKVGMFYQKGMPSEHSLAFAFVQTFKGGFVVNTIPILGGSHKYVMLPDGSVLEN